MIWKSRLGWKVFGMLLLNAAVIIGVMAGAFRWNVSQGVEKLVRDQAQDRLAQVADLLGKAYQREGSWERVLQRPEIRGLLVMPFGPSPESFHEREDDDEEESHRRYRQFRMLPTSLLDERGRVLAGRPPAESALRIPVKAFGRTVGTLAMSVRPRIPGSREDRFLDQQEHLMWTLAFSMGLMAVLLSLGLTWSLLRPIQSLAVGTQAIASRKFDTRIPPHGRDELGQLAEDFNRMASNLEAFEEERRRWIADTSHELGTPLAVLRGEIEALQDGIREPTPERLNSLHSEVMRLTRLVEDLKLINRAEAGRLELQQRPLDLTPFLRELTARFANRLEQSQLEVEWVIAPSLWVRADPERLEQVFTNLLENVLRYADPPGTLRLSGMQQGARVRCTVEDSGPGVSESLLPRLFDRFFRVEGSRNRETGGSGLGLAICKNLIEAHDGTIQARHSELGGLCIEIELPQGQEP